MKEKYISIITTMLMITTIFTISVTAEEPVLDQYCHEENDCDMIMFANERLAQSFKPTMDTLTKIRVKICRAAETEHARFFGFYLIDSLDAEESLVQWNGAVNALPDEPIWLNLQIDPPLNVNIDSEYFIAFGLLWDLEDSDLMWHGTSTDYYNRGQAYMSEDSGDTWDEPYCCLDFNFETYGYNENPDPDYYDLTLEIEGQGSVEIEPSEGPYEEGTEVTITADPDTGYVFDHWEGDASGDGNPKTITMNEDKQITAVFDEEQVNQYTLTINIEGCGTVDPAGGTYDEGTIVTINAESCEGWHFDHWSGDASGCNNPRDITMSKDKTITAVFEEGEIEELTVEIDGPYIYPKDTSIHFNCEVVGGVQPYSYKWSFGDDSTSTKENPSHSYSKTGTYTVTLEVEDNIGNTATATSFAGIGKSYQNRNAVILVGDAFDSTAHYLDMVIAAAEMHDCLTSSKYNFKKSEVHVLSKYDIPDIDTGENIVDRTASKGELQTVLNDIKESDMFFFVYIGHGVFESTEKQYFLLKDGEKLYDYQLSDYVEEIKGQHIYALHACNSGGFIPELSKSGAKRIICTSTKSGYLTTEYMLEGWIHYFIDSLNGEGDFIPDNIITIEEAFYYAEQRAYREPDINHGDLGQEPILDDNNDNQGHSPHTGEYTRIPNTFSLDGGYASINTLNMGPKSTKIKQKNTIPEVIENFVIKIRTLYNLFWNLLQKVIN